MPKSPIRPARPTSPKVKVRKGPRRKRGDPSRVPQYIAEHGELVEAIRAVWHEWSGNRATEAQHAMVNEWVDRRVRECLGLGGSERSA